MGLMAGKCNKENIQDGWKLHCLRQNVASLTSAGCKAGIQKYAIRLSKDIRASAFIQAHCDNDLAKFCPTTELGRARGIKCLKDNVDKLENQVCKKFVERQAKLQATS